MKLIETAECQKKEIEEIDFDFFIASSGFEERASFIVKNIKIKSNVKKVICFNNYQSEGFRKKNDDFFRENNYEFVFEEGEQFHNIINLLDEISNINKYNIKIGVDYSSMTSVWYSTIISYFNKLNTTKKISIHFFYSFSKFSDPINSNVRNIHIGPINDFSTLSIPDKPTALIVGLGYERERAFGLAEYFEAETYIFTADKSKGVKYYDAVKFANKNLFNYAKSQNIFEYSLHHLDNAESLLYSVCKSLKSDFRLVLAPTGPKPFTLLCLLVAIRLRNIDVWRISAGKFSKPTNKIPDGTWSCHVATFN